MDQKRQPRGGWGFKFACAWRGLKSGIRGHSSFQVHFLVVALVIAAGIALRVSRVDWCLLALCIAGVLAAELFNSALEELAAGFHREHDPHLARALDIASGAVLLAALGAACVGMLVLGWRLVERFV